jgi:hypothetical protein
MADVNFTLLECWAIQECKQHRYILRSREDGDGIRLYTLIDEDDGEEILGDRMLAIVINFLGWIDGIYEVESKRRTELESLEPQEMAQA